MCAYTCTHMCVHSWPASWPLIAPFVKQRVRIPWTVMCLRHITVPSAPSLPIGPLQGALGTQSVLAIPKGEPPCGLPPWIPQLHHRGRSPIDVLGVEPWGEGLGLSESYKCKFYARAQRSAEFTRKLGCSKEGRALLWLNARAQACVREKSVHLLAICGSTPVNLSPNPQWGR